MSEYQRQAAFLKALMVYQDTAEHRLLEERLSSAERNEQCLSTSCRLVAIIALLGFSGLGYSAVLLPEFFNNSTHFLVQFFSALGLGSMMCLAVFLGFWLWFRGVVNRIHEECRKSITEMMESRFGQGATCLHPLVSEAPSLTIRPHETASSSGNTEFRVRQAS
jgi:hypothetical protein